MQKNITVYVAFAKTATEQHYFTLQVPAESLVEDVLQHPELVFLKIDVDNIVVGVFSKKVTLDYCVQAGDRIEVYRPLARDPMKKRRLKFANKKKQHQ